MSTSYRPAPGPHADPPRSCRRQGVTRFPLSDIGQGGHQGTKRLLHPEGLLRLDPPERPFHRCHETRLAERLHHVIERVHLEGPMRVLTVRRHQHHTGRQVVSERFQNAEAVAIRHLDVEKEQVGASGPNDLDRLSSVRGLSHHLDGCDVVQQRTYGLPRRRLVVDDDGADRLAGLHAKAPLGSRAAGSSIRTSVPPPSASRISKSCSSP